MQRYSVRSEPQNVPARKITNAWIFLHQILLICLAENCAEACSSHAYYFLLVVQHFNSVFQRRKFVRSSIHYTAVDQQKIEHWLWCCTITSPTIVAKLNWFTQFCVSNKRRKFDVKKFVHNTDIIVFVLRHFNLALLTLRRYARLMFRN